MFDLQSILNEHALKSNFNEDGIWCFAPKTQVQIAHDKYENITDNIDFYTWLAYSDNSASKETVSIYSRLNQILQQELDANNPGIILDVGCGVGRTLYDLSDFFTTSQLIGCDYSMNMLRRARQILRNNESLKIDLTSSGLPAFLLKGKKTDHVHLVQANVLDLPFQSNSVNAIVNTFLIDRVDDVALALQQMINVLKPEGLFVLSSPLNFQKAQNWKYGHPLALIQLLKELGMDILEYEDNITHSEVLDARGNTKVWNTLMIWGRKRNGI